MSTNTGTNERGRDITYIVMKDKEELFRITGKRFNKAKVIKECKARGIESPVQVHYITLQLWGFKDVIRGVFWKEESDEPRGT